MEHEMKTYAPHGAPLPLLGVKTGSALLWGANRKNETKARSGFPQREGWCLAIQPGTGPFSLPCQALEAIYRAISHADHGFWPRQWAFWAVRWPSQSLRGSQVRGGSTGEDQWRYLTFQCVSSWKLA